VRTGAVRTIHVAPQSSAPGPGPTLEVLLGRAAAFAARIVVD
jgi:hypothetical protein